mgnify:CR=1 FL=1
MELVLWKPGWRAPDRSMAPARPEPGQVLEVADGVLWLRMALPFALNHINLWLLRDRFEGRDGWTMVDTCIDIRRPDRPGRACLNIT